MVNNITILSILEPLLFTQDWVHLAEISRSTNIPHPTARIYLNEYEKNGVVVKKNQGRLTLFKLNYTNPLTADYVSLVEKNKLINKCFKDLLLKEIVAFLRSLSNTSLIFGSATSSLKSANDVDLVVLGEIDKKRFKEFEKKHGISFHVINLKKLDDMSPALKEEIKKKHLIIQDTDIIIRWMLTN